jgi:NitT/TauT family transport system substrate-binding protein
MPMPSQATEVLRISATAHGLNYLPEYFAQASGLFEQVGLTVINTPRDPWTGVLDDLESGAADVALGGLWVPAMYAGSDRQLLTVGQLNARFPMAVLLREAAEDFQWPVLNGKTVLVPGIGGTAPYEFTAGLIREAGVTLDGTRFSRDLSSGMLIDLWRAGLGDAFVVDLLTAMTLAHEGLGSIAFRHAEAGGVMPNSVYYIDPERLPELRDRLIRFMAAISNAMDQLDGGAPPDAATELARSRWPDRPASVLDAAVQELSANRTWSSAAVDPDACARWVRILDEAGLIHEPSAAPYLVDQTIAAGALAWRSEHAI